MEQICFVVNPAAGGNSCLRKFSAAEERLRELGVPYTALYSEYEGHVTKLVRQALTAGETRVVAVGGDGTAREVAQELLHGEAVMGILPFGTGNDLIRALNIPAQWEDALDLILHAEPRPMDAATVNGQIFLNVAGFGFDVDVLEKTRMSKGRFRGVFAYLVGLLQALIHLKDYQVTLRANGSELTGRMMLVSVGNGTSIGGGMMVTPKAHPADGLLDVCLVRQVGRLKVLRCLARFVKGRHLELEFVQYFNATELTVDSSPPARIQLDGEIICETPAEIQILPGALQVLAGELALRRKADPDDSCGEVKIS